MNSAQKSNCPLAREREKGRVGKSLTVIANLLAILLHLPLHNIYSCLNLQPTIRADFGDLMN